VTLAVLCYGTCHINSVSTQTTPMVFYIQHMHKTSHIITYVMITGFSHFY